MPYISQSSIDILKKTYRKYVGEAGDFSSGMRNGLYLTLALLESDEMENSPTIGHEINEEPLVSLGSSGYETNIMESDV